MQQTEHDPEEVAGTASPRQSDDRPPVGEPLVVSRRNPAARPAGKAAPVDAHVNGAGRASTVAAPAVDPRSVQLAGRVAVVTSAAGELGSALAAELVGRGARVMLVDDDLVGLLEVADSLSFGRVVPVRCDLGSDDDVTAACAFVSGSTTVDLVVHVDGPDPEDPANGSVGLVALDARYRRSVRGPVALLDGLAGSFAPSSQVVLVGPSSGDASVAFAGAAPDVVRAHLPVVDGSHVMSVECGAGLGAGAVAGTLMDLLVRDDVMLDRVTLLGSVESVTTTAPEPAAEDSGDELGLTTVASGFDGGNDLGR